MRLPSSFLPKALQSPCRFCVVGLIGTLIQTGFFELALAAFGYPQKGTGCYYTAFAIGFTLEMIPNFLLSNFYVFQTRPNWVRARGFLIARAVNLAVQFGFLPILIFLFSNLQDDFLSMICIVLAGIVNYFILRFFFKSKPHEA